MVPRPVRIALALGSLALAWVAACGSNANGGHPKACEPPCVTAKDGSCSCPTPCTTDDQCPGVKVCMNGSCVDARCNTDSDCTLCEFCDHGICAEGNCGGGSGVGGIGGQAAGGAGGAGGMGGHQGTGGAGGSGGMGGHKGAGGA